MDKKKHPVAQPNLPKWCSGCGGPLKKIVYGTSFDIHSREQVEYYYLRCPKYSSWNPFTWNHDDNV